MPRYIGKVAARFTVWFINFDVGEPVGFEDGAYGRFTDAMQG